MAWDHRFRRVTYCALAAIVLAAALGLLGVRTTVATATGNGIGLAVTHSVITRPGLATPFLVEITSTDGSPLPPRLTVGITSAYLRMLDDNGMEPLPAESFNTNSTTWWTFEIPDGESTLLIDVDARLEPAVQWGSGRAKAQVWVGGAKVVEADFSTWVMP